jgi:putative PEP-CTERM system TPR-repeat lipoprotein
MSSRRPILWLPLTLILLAGCSKSARQYYDSGNTYFGEQKYKEAVVEYKNAVQKDPKFGEAHLKLAETYVKLNELGGAIREYVYAADLMPENTDVQLRAGAFLLIAQRFDDAKARAEKVLARDPKSVEAQLLLGNATYGLKDLDGAIKQVEEAIQLAPSAWQTFTMLGGLESVKGNPEAAEKAFKQAIDLDPTSAYAHLALGRFLAGAGRAGEAEASFKKAYELEPKNSMTGRALAAFYMTSNRPAEAEPYLKAIADSSTDPAPTIALADYYIAVQRTDEAVALLNKVAGISGAHVDAKVRLAGIEYGRKKTVEAHKTIDEVLANDPHEPRALLVKARFLIAERKIDEAIAKARDAVTADPRSVPAHYMLAGLYTTKNNNDEAIKEYNEVLKLNPRATAAQLQLSRLQMLKGASGPAVQLAEQAVGNQPDNPVARLILARSLMGKGELARAETELKALEAKYPRVAPVQAGLGSLALLKNDAAGARKAYEKALAIDQDSNEALAGLLALDAVSKKLSEAKTRVEARLARTPNDPLVLTMAARTYATAGDFAKAEQMLRKAIEVAPDTLQAYGMLGQIYVSQRKLPQAREEFAALAARQSKPVAAETMIGMILQVEGKPAEAQKQYEKVIALEPRAPVAANNLAWLYAEAGTNLDTALQLAQTAKAGLPESPEVDDTLGWIYYKKDLVSQALPPLQAAVARNAQNPEYLYHLGMAQVKSGDVMGGRQSLEKAIQLNPNFTSAAEARKALASIR